MYVYWTQKSQQTHVLVLALNFILLLISEVPLTLKKKWQKQYIPQVAEINCLSSLFPPDGEDAVKDPSLMLFAGMWRGCRGRRTFKGMRIIVCILERDGLELQSRRDMSGGRSLKTTIWVRGQGKLGKSMKCSTVHSNFTNSIFVVEA